MAVKKKKTATKIRTAQELHECHPQQTQIVGNQLQPVPWSELALADKVERLRALMFEVLTRTNLTSMKILL